MLNPVDLTKELISRQSLTPLDAGCQDFIYKTLKPFDFKAHYFPCQDVQNIFIQRGKGSPHFMFVGHTDVVPSGEENLWLHPPFQPTITNGCLYGRGVADMKGGIAAFITACARFVTQNPHHPGTLSLLLTSDEEGKGVHGIRHVVEQWQQEGINQEGMNIDYCLVGEPTSEHQLGDIIKIGRRGSLTAYLKIKGIQGHIAYPALAKNPIHLAIPFLDWLIQTTWDKGNEHFQPTQVQIASINAGAGATNIIPGEIDIVFNFRFNPEQNVEILQERIVHELKKKAYIYDIDWSWSGNTYYCPPQSLAQNAAKIIEKNCGFQPKFTTDGGTSDGRFMATISHQIIELGLLNQTIHQINEHVPLQDLEQLSSIYEELLIAHLL